MPRKSEPTIFSLNGGWFHDAESQGIESVKQHRQKNIQDQHHESDRVISSLTFDLLKVVGKKTKWWFNDDESHGRKC